MNRTMVPGQEPYTEEERRGVYILVGDACAAEDVFSDCELEEFARIERETKEKAKVK